MPCEFNAKTKRSGAATELKSGNLTQRREERGETQRRQNHLWQNHGKEIVFCVCTRNLAKIARFLLIALQTKGRGTKEKKRIFIQQNRSPFSDRAELHAGYQIPCGPIGRRSPIHALGLLVLALTLSGARATLLREYWLNIPRALVSDLTSNTKFPDNPSGSNQLATFEAPINWADTYGTRIRGYITPAVTGSYLFWISSDDASELWLSTSDDPDYKVLIASVPGWTNSREWNKYPSQQSAAINLVSGQQYYVEALHKEAYGRDNVAAGGGQAGGSTHGAAPIHPRPVLLPPASAKLRSNTL